MDDVFSDFVRRLTASGEPPEPASFDEVREHLRALVVTEMRKRGLWTASPSYLGVVASSWRDDPAALEELVGDAYGWVLIDRLRSLAHQLEVVASIQGLVVRNVRQFLTDRQRKADPLGYRVFVRLRAAVERLLELGRLFLLGLAGKLAEKPEPPRVGNGSVLTFSPGLAAVAAAQVVAEPVARWNDRLMPALVLAESRAVAEVVERLAEEVAGLEGVGVRAFRFGDVAKALKDDARRRWEALWERQQEREPEDGAPGAARVPIVRPDESAHEKGFRAAVLACVEQAISAIRQAKRQRDLWKVWVFLRSTRVDAEEAREVPSFSELGRELEMPRERVPQLLDQLKQLVRGCMESAGVGVVVPETDVEPAEPARMWGDRGRR